MAVDKASLDCGNAQVKIVTSEGEAVFPHALKVMSQSDIANLQLVGELESDVSVYKVNGIYYRVGKKAIKTAGAALYGEARYTETYYGVLCAIALFNGFKNSKRNVFLYGSHTPKDKMYRNDMILAVKSNWTVESGGTVKTFRVVDANGFEEPVGAFRHATLGDDGQSMRGSAALRKGSSLIIDVGGFTVGLTTAEGGVIDYSSSDTEGIGMLDVLEEFEFLIRRNHAKKLKGVNFLDPNKLRDALTSGRFDAGGHGELNVTEEREQSIQTLLRAISQFYERFGGTSSYHGILLAGGGSVPLEKRIRETLQHPSISVAEEDRTRMHLGTAMGGMKVLRLLESKGKL